MGTIRDIMIHVSILRGLNPLKRSYGHDTTLEKLMAGIEESQSAEARLWARYKKNGRMSQISSLNPLKRGYGHDTIKNTTLAAQGVSIR